MLYLRQPALEDRQAVAAAYARSTNLHNPWTYAPRNLDEYLAQEGRYFLCLSESETIVGTFNISGIIRGYFQSAHLGYEVFSPFDGKGYMTAGICLILKEAFETLNLHRLEANIQPGNTASLKLAARAGFVKEGFSREYLRIGGKAWQDHERWAVINRQWREPGK